MTFNRCFPGNGYIAEIEGEQHPEVGDQIEVCVGLPRVKGTVMALNDDGTLTVRVDDHVLIKWCDDWKGWERAE